MIIMQLLEEFNQFSLNMEAFSPSMRQMARLLLTNQQGGPLGQMHIRPGLPAGCKTIGAIVVHTISVFSSNSSRQILLPFINMLNNPAELMVSCVMSVIAI